MKNSDPMAMKTKIILNPKSGDGKVAKNWESIQSELKRHNFKYDTEYTTAQDSATAMARKALKEGYERIIAVGGDGTLSETVNGFFEDGKQINPDAVFSFIMSGRGNDFRKTFGISKDLKEAVDRCVNGKVRKIDLVRIDHQNHSDEKVVRYFMNIASVGMGGEVASRVNQSRLGKYIGGKGVFYYESLMALLSYKNKNVRIRIDDTFDQKLKIRLICIANGQYAGGGMWFAPHADISDGILEVMILKDVSKLTSFGMTGTIYKGKLKDHKDVITLRGKKITVESDEKVLLEVDGEVPGTLSATYEVIPSCLNLQI